MKRISLHTITDDEWRRHYNSYISSRCNTTASNVAQFRRKQGKPKGPRSPGSGRRPRIDQSLIDWSLSNTENAARLNCTPQYLAYLRRNKNSIEDFA